MTDFKHIGEPTLLSIVGQGMGFVSVCWSDIDSAGVFDSRTASNAVTSVVNEIRNLMHGRLVALLDQTGTATEWNDAIEAAIKALVEHR